MGQILLEIVSNDMKYSKTSESCQHLMKVKLWLTEMMSFCEMISLVYVRVDIASIKIKKAFDTVSQGIFKDKLMKSELKKADRKVHWKPAEQQGTKIWLVSESSYRPVTSSQHY